MIRGLITRVEKLLKAKAAYKFFLKDWTSLKDLQATTSALETMRFTRNLAPEVMEAPAGKRLCVLAPHGDDDIFGCGGMLLKAMAGGASAHTLYLCAGSPREDMMGEIEAATPFIPRTYEILDYPAGAFPLDAESVAAFRDRVMAVQPDVLVLPFFTDDHDEHRRASEMLLAAFEGTDLLRGVEVWAYQVYSMLPPNVVVDVTDQIAVKRQACEVFASQMTSRDWVNYVIGRDAMMSRFMNTGGKTAWAEAYFVLPAEEYLAVVAQYFANPADCYYGAHYKKVNLSALKG